MRISGIDSSLRLSYASPYMSIPRLILAITITLALLLVANCSNNNNESASPSSQKLSPDAELCKQVIIDFWNAFNSYDLEKCLSYIEPTYAEVEERAGIESDLERFEMGRILGVRLVPSDFKEYPPLEDGRLDIRYTLSIKPKGLQEDEYQMCYMVKLNGVWKIAVRTYDPDKTPPSEPSNLQVTIVSDNRVDLTWEDRSSRETGYRVERALDTAFKTDLVSVILPANSHSYSDTTTVAGVIYYYRVFAFNKLGDSNPTRTFPARMPGS